MNMQATYEYFCFYKLKKVAVHSNSTFDAQLLAANILKVPPKLRGAIVVIKASAMDDVIHSL